METAIIDIILKNKTTCIVNLDCAIESALWSIEDAQKLVTKLFECKDVNRPMFDNWIATNEPAVSKFERRLVVCTAKTLDSMSGAMQIETAEKMISLAGNEGLVLIINNDLCNECTCQSQASNSIFSNLINNEPLKLGQDILKKTPNAYFIGRKIGKPAVDQNDDNQENETAEEKERREVETKVGNFYNSEATKWYKGVWGNGDISVGVYEKEADPAHTDRTLQIKQASINAKHELWKFAKKHVPQKFFDQGLRVVDFGSGFGGTSRFLVENGVAFVSCVDLSSHENTESRKTIHDLDLGLSISNPFNRSYTDTGEPSESYHLIVSQDALLHAGEFREFSIKEASRLLKKDGILCFNDSMMSDNIEDLSVLKPVLERLNLANLSSVNTYKTWGAKYGLEFVEFVDFTKMAMETHYENVRLEMISRGDELGLSKAFQERQNDGLKHWVSLAKSGHLSWGYLVFKKF